MIKIFVAILFIKILIFYYLYTENNEKMIGNFYLSEIHNGIYYLYEKDSKSVIKKGIIYNYNYNNHYVLYGIDVKLCDKDSIYFIINNKRYYYVIDKKSNKLVEFDDIDKFYEYANINKIKIKNIDFVDEYIEKTPNNIDLGKKDDCI